MNGKDDFAPEKHSVESIDLHDDEVPTKLTADKPLAPSISSEKPASKTGSQTESRIQQLRHEDDQTRPRKSLPSIHEAAIPIKETPLKEDMKKDSKSDLEPRQARPEVQKLPKAESPVPKSPSAEEMKAQGHKVAVRLVNVNFQSRSTKILNNVNMTILEGQIYGLLGPSGCGKTTLLKTIVGLNRPTSGTVLVFGKKPGTNDSIVPGPDVGFMPQDISLYVDFTVSETLNFFARVAGLSKSERKKRKEFMYKFLELPPAGRRVHYLSGGQRRRVSLAAALMQNPTFLILDEPTVGIDPVLRETIWKHLLHLTIQNKITIIITTHYIEEAQRAGRIAFMRQGCLLAEEDPKILMQVFQTPSLEVVFLKFCLADGGKIAEFDSRTKTDLSKLPNATRKRTRFSCEGATKIYALVIKGAIRTSRNIPNLVIQILQPGVQMFLFCLCFGRKPDNLPLGVFDEDERYSKEFLSRLKNKRITYEYFTEFDEAYDAVKKTKLWGFFHFGRFYTEAMQNRFMKPLLDNLSSMVELLRMKITEAILKAPPTVPTFPNITVGSNGSAIYYGDFSSFPIKSILTVDIANASSRFLKEFLFEEAKEAIANGTSAINEISNLTSFFAAELDNMKTQKIIDTQAIYGDTSSEGNFIDYAVPGMVISIAYFLAASLTALSFVIERKEGVLERGRIAGIKAYEFVVSHIILQFAIVLFQCITSLLVAYIIFHTTMKGSLFLAGFLAILQGIGGMSYGLLISALCSDEVGALMAIIATFLPILILSGVVWPLDAMPVYIRYFSYILPQTFACEAMRSVALRGWGFLRFQVWLSVIIILAWAFVHNLLAVIFFQ